MNLSEKLRRKKMVFGMVHVVALPGTPKYKNNWQHLKHKAIKEAEIYQSAGLDGFILENMHDLPYIKRKVGPEIVACMTAIANQVKNKVGNPCWHSDFSWCE